LATGSIEKQIRRKIWEFTRSPSTGLPSSTLNARTDWHNFLKIRVKEVLDSLKDEFGFYIVDNLGSKLKSTDLPNSPLLNAENLAPSSQISIRIETVHQVKGETLDAVLYIANKQNIMAMIEGVSTEEGRIGYVAVTRAKNLFWLGVPIEDLPNLRAKLLDKELKEFSP
jgi:superfamily I DNA/RNA helicase